MTGYNNPALGVILIGRNEGDRLKRCIQSISLDQYPAVYVDSGSVDDSVAFCRQHNVDVVELDLTTPFTAARARNAGLARIISLYPQLEYVQFIDGDCQLNAQWLSSAYEFLQKHSEYAAACGRRQETNPSASIYNALCDIEWDTPVGDARSCGGDVLMRVAAFQSVAGFSDILIAGEEPELCYRLRQAGWKICRLDAPMTLHDANITRFNQWWKRSRRAGYAYMTGALLHGRSPERYYVRPVLRALLWGALLPVLSLGFAIINPIWLVLLTAYPLQWFKLTRSAHFTQIRSGQWAFFTVLSKFPELAGILHCLYDNLLSKNAVLIEYK